MASFKGNIYEVLRKPLITEKAASASTGRGAVAVFEVHPEASKKDIQVAVEKIFSVKVREVRTVNILGKEKRGRRSVGKQRDTKKAYVALEAGSSIDIVEGL